MTTEDRRALIDKLEAKQLALDAKDGRDVLLAEEVDQLYNELYPDGEDEDTCCKCGVSFIEMVHFDDYQHIKSGGRCLACDGIREHPIMAEARTLREWATDIREGTTGEGLASAMELMADRLSLPPLMVINPEPMTDEQRSSIAEEIRKWHLDPNHVLVHPVSLQAEGRCMPPAPESFSCKNCGAADVGRLLLIDFEGDFRCPECCSSDLITVLGTTVERGKEG